MRINPESRKLSLSSKEGQVLNKVSEYQGQMDRMQREQSREMNSYFDQMRQVVDSNMAQFSDVHQDKGTIAREYVLRDMLFEKKDASGRSFIERLPEASRSRALKIKEEWDGFLKRSQAEDGVMARKAFKYFKAVQGPYSRAADKLRQKPEEAQIPHPKNTRVLGAVTQDVKNPGSEDQKLPSWSTQKFKEALQNTDSIDGAINRTTNQVKVDGAPTETHTGNPQILKPIATDRQNPDTWKKSDNSNSKVKRIAIFVQTGNNEQGFGVESRSMREYFKKQSVSEYIHNPDKDKDKHYRVDETFVVEEATPGKVKVAFEQARSFVKKERDMACQNAIAVARSAGLSEKEQKIAGDKAARELQFEGFAHWAGHGSIDQSKNPKDNAALQEGAKEFQFSFEPSPETISESAIKGWEKEYLNEDYFRSFIHYYSSCHSGAITS